MQSDGSLILRFGALIAVLVAVALSFLFMRAPATEEDVVTSFLKATGIPGAVLAYGPANGVPTVKAYGTSNPITQTPMQADQVLPLASLTKPITAAALLALAKAGEVDLDAPLAEQIALPAPHDPRAARITPRHLLAHRGGFDRNQSFDPVFAPERMGLTRDKSCRDLARAAWSALPLDHAPGSTKAYSNIGICLMTDLLTVNGTRDLEEVLQSEAAITLSEPAGPNWAMSEEGWVEVQTSQENRQWRMGLGAAGGTAGRTEDVWRFAARAPEAANAPAPEGETGDFYALGWRIWPGPDGRQLTHWGGLSGVFTAMFRLSDDTVVVVLFNAAPINFDQSFNALFDGFCKVREINCRPAN